MRSNEKHIDSVLSPNIVFQITVRQHRTLTLDILQDLVQTLKTDEDDSFTLDFYFVIPKSIINKFTYSKLSLPNNIQIFVACPTNK